MVKMVLERLQDTVTRSEVAAKDRETMAAQEGQDRVAKVDEVPRMVGLAEEKARNEILI